jgi:hypothetical protein
MQKAILIGLGAHHKSPELRCAPHVDEPTREKFALGDKGYLSSIDSGENIRCFRVENVSLVCVLVAEKFGGGE